MMQKLALYNVGQMADIKIINQYKFKINFMKYLLFLVVSFFQTGLLQAQDIQVCTKVYVKIFSEAPLENIEAVSEKGVSAINPVENTLYFAVPVRTLDFEKDLMEEHFNENYMESEKYPNAIYNGTFSSDVDWTTPGEYDVTVEGTFEVHGVEQQRTDAGKIVIDEDGNITANALFKVACADHKIKIPKLVVKNIAEEIEVTIKGSYAPKK